jgi:hypothetical protein
MNVAPASILNKVIQPVFKNKRLYDFTKKMATSENFYSGVALSIIVVKHGIEAAIHAKASYNNKKVPEEQRNFLAIQDAVNYTLAIVLMITLGRFLGTKGKTYITEQNKTVSKLLKKLAPEVAKEVKTGIGVGLTLMGPILSHRIMTPLLSMPVSKVLKERFFPDIDVNNNQKPYINACEAWYSKVKGQKLNYSG